MKLIRLVIMILVFVINRDVNAQMDSQKDSFEYAKKKAWQGQYHEALRILENQKISEKKVDFYTFYSELLYWTQQFKEADIIYKEALQIFPNYFPFYKMYGIFLYNTGKYHQAFPYLVFYHQLFPVDVEVNLKLAWIYHWNGNEKKAFSLVNSLLLLDLTSPDLIILKQEIINNISPNFELNTELKSDDQPLKNYQYKLLVSKYYSPFLSPSLEISHGKIITDSSNEMYQYIKASNRFIHSKSGLTADFTLGSFSRNKSQLTGGIVLGYPITKNIKIMAGWFFEPYLNTVSSQFIVKPILIENRNMSISYNNIKNKWMGNISYNQMINSFFEKLNSISSWVLIPLLKKKKLIIWSGYSFAFNNSDSNLYSPLQNTNGTYRFNGDGSIKGIYNPCFTPSNQFIHSILFNTQLKFIKNWNIGTRISYGFFAHMDNPYLYLDKKNTGEIIIKTGYEKYNYNPIEIELNIKYTGLKKNIISVQYLYNSLFFYSMHSFQVKYMYKFMHEKK